MFEPRWTSDRQGVEWVMRTGTPAEPLLYSQQRQVFQLGVAASSLTQLVVKVNGAMMASQGFALGGRTDGLGLVSVSTDSTLTDAGYPLLEVADTSHSTVSEVSTLQQYSDELAVSGRTPVTTWTFNHQLSEQPYLSGFNVGDFATVSVRGNAYLEDGRYSMRVLSRSGELGGTTVRLQFAPEVVSNG